MGLMTHVVAGYPSFNECIELMLGMQKLGVDLIEVQIPFSDPIADGETIMQANDVALKNGMDIKKSFELIKQAKNRGLTANIYIMSYVQKLIHFGVDDFCSQAAKVGAKGLIIADLPFDSEEYEALLAAANKFDLEIVPVVSPGMSRTRLQNTLKDSGNLVYLTSTKGITGNRLLVSAELAKAAQDIKKLAPNLSLAIGFGIQNKQDVKEVLKIADIAVVGSSVIRKIDQAGVKAGLDLVGELVG